MWLTHDTGDLGVDLQEVSLPKEQFLLLGAVERSVMKVLKALH